MEYYKVLTDLGFAKNEAIVYLAMLSSGKALNGYEIAKYSGVTRTMIYDILNRLQAKHAVRVIEADPLYYLPVDYKALVDNMRKQSEERLDKLEAALEKISVSNVRQKHFVYNINGTEEIFRILKNKITGASDEIYLSAWREEAELIGDELQKASDRGVKVYLFSFNKLPFSFGTQFVYGFDWSNEDYFPRRRITAIIDRRTMVMGEGGRTSEEINIVTDNAMLIEMAINQILLDIWHLYACRKDGFLREGMNSDDYRESIREMQSRYGLPEDLPRTLEEWS